MHEYPVEHETLDHIRKLLSKQQRKYLLSGAHYLILDNGAFYEHCWQQLTNSKTNYLNKPSFVIYGMSHGDILIEFSQTDKKSATLLCIKPHLPPQPHFIKSWVFALLEKIFGISFGPKGFCRYTKDRPFVISPQPDSPKKNINHPALSSQSAFLPNYCDSKRKLKNYKNTDHIDFNQFPKNHSKLPTP